MDSFDNTFEWIDLPEGRARFSGTKRGWDELGHKTFAVAMGDVEYFGELRRSYLENGNDYNIEITSFGYGRGEDVGMPDPAARAAFSEQQVMQVQSLVIQLITAGLAFDDPPTVLDQTETSRFMGKVLFRDRWALVKDGVDV